MTTADQVTYERVWWVMGPVPQDLRTRWPQDVVDPPSNGWHGVLVYRPKREDAKYAQVFDPATGWGRDVALESMELNGSKPVMLDESKMIARIRKTCAERDKLGCGMSYGKANFFLRALGAEEYVRINTVEDEEPGEKPQREPKPAKVDPRAGLIQASDIAAKLNIEPRILRDACRKLGIEKPAIGWCGSQQWADHIEKSVIAFLHSPKEAKPHIAKGAREVAKEKKAGKMLADAMAPVLKPKKAKKNVQG